MALSDRHWITGALLACAIIAAAKLPPDGKARPRRTEAVREVAMQERARRQLREESDKLALLQRRDSALAVAARAARAERRAADADARGTPPRVSYGSDVPSALRVPIDSLIRMEIDGMRSPLGAVPVVVLVVTDTAAHADSTLPGHSRTQWIDADYVLPSAADGRTCISIVSVGKGALRDAAQPGARRPLDAVLARSAGSMLGPCAWFAAHGMPGPHIERWLAQSHWLPALRAPASGTDTLRIDPFVRFTRSVRASPVERLLRAGGAIQAAEHYPPDIVACAAGDEAGCRGALRLVDSMPDRAVPPALLRSSGAAFDRERWPAARSPLGTAAIWMFASLHDQLGAETFGRFWRSELEPEQAYASATGSSLSTAASGWIRDTYDIGALRHGPHPLALSLKLLLGAAALLLALAARGRRTVRV